MITGLKKCHSHLSTAKKIVSSVSRQWSALRGGPHEIRKFSCNVYKCEGEGFLCVSVTGAWLRGLTETHYGDVALEDRKQWFAGCAYYNSWVFFKCHLFHKISCLLSSSSGITASLGNTSIFSLARCLSGRPDTLWVWHLSGGRNLPSPCSKHKRPRAVFLARQFSLSVLICGWESDGHDGIKGVIHFKICPWTVG